MFDNFEDTPPDLLQERIQGSRAKNILGNEAFEAAILNMKGSLLQAWKSTNLSATQERDYYWLQMKAIDALVRNLESMIETGKMAEIQLEQEDKRLLQQLKDKLFG